MNKLFTDLGCASAVLINDYGEDLVVQPCLGGEVDNFQIYVQVKTVSWSRGGVEKPYVTVNLDHLRRWANMINPVVVCAHDNMNDEIYVLYVKNIMSRWRLIGDRRKTIRLPLKQGYKIDKENGGAFIWDCRMSYYSRLIALSLGELEERVALEDWGEENEPADIYLICIEVLVEINLIGVGRMDDRFLAWVDEYVDQVSTDGTSDLQGVFILALVRYIQETCGVGIPYNLVEWLPQVAAHTYMNFYPEKWDRISGVFSSSWSPFSGEDAPIADR